ncbi:MAG: PH domain-containing protein, partial [Candidatus Altiarchaeota archaeon]|nr:PH domain-containing protein [Candidatus Altiarchaeota archaeon]
KIEFKWVAVMLGVGILSAATAYCLHLSPDAAYTISIFYCFIGIYLVELYRRAHVFFITNYRVVTEVNFLSHKRNELSYDKINNVVLEQGIIASILNFGTIIPVTASGLGMGADFSAVSVGGMGQVKGGPFLGGQVTGGRTVQTPRARSMYCLFGVTNPEEVHKLITKYMHGYTNAPYLKKMTEQLDDLKKTMQNK